MITKLVSQLYGLTVIKVEKTPEGAGSDTYFITTEQGEFVLKFPSPSDINHPEQEPALCAFLRKEGLPVSHFIKTLGGEYVGKDESGRICTLQECFRGETLPWNSFSDTLLWEKAELLGKIHNALAHYPALPVGIGADFFRFMTPQRTRLSYEKSLALAISLGEEDNAEDLRYRMALMDRLPPADFDLSCLHCGPTHGDYYISQLLCQNGHINAVIDWTCACVHPLVWELARSYVFAAPECAQGIFDMNRFANYTAHYEKFAPLNDYDKACAKALYMYQIAVCDYYGQYYASQEGNREIFLSQAKLATKLLQREYPV